MPICGIMRIEKRGRSAVHGLQIEANRTEEDHKEGRDFDKSDIDWSKTHENIHLAFCPNWNRAITSALKSADLKERKNSIVLLDGLYTASPEFFARTDPDKWIAYFKECLDFHIREYCQGDRSRLLNAVIHLDETAPHLQVASIPIMEDEKGAHLSAKNIMGNRTEYRKRQDRFFDEVTASYGLERGEMIEYERDEKGILHRTEDAKVHTTKREWQIAALDEAFTQKLGTLSKAIDRHNEYSRLIERQKEDFSQNKDRIEEQDKISLSNQTTIAEQKKQIASNQKVLEEQKKQKEKNSVEIKMQSEKITAVGNYMQKCYGYKKPFGNKGMVMYHENSERINRQFQDEFDASVRKFMSLPNDIKLKEKEAEENLQKAKEAKLEAEKEKEAAHQQLQRIRQSILEKAYELLDFRLSRSNFSKLERAINFMENYRVGGRTLSEEFEYQERLLMEEIQRSTYNMDLDLDMDL